MLFFRNGSHIIVRTPPLGNRTLSPQEGEVMQLEFQYTPTFPVTVPAEFEYLPNPVIDEIVNLKTIST